MKVHVTDDTELAISLCRGIIDMINHQEKKDTIKHVYDSHYVAKQYLKWYDSDPFDIGKMKRRHLIIMIQWKNNMNLVVI